MGNTCCSLFSSSENENVMDINPLLEQVQDVDQLDDFISLIEERLAAISAAMNKPQETTNTSTQETASSSRLPPFIKFGKDFSEKVLKRLNRQSFKLDRETRKLVIDALKGVAQAHWLVAGLSVVAYVIDQIDLVSENKTQCVQLLGYACALAKHIKQLDTHLSQEKEKLNDAVHFIVKGSLMCLAQMKAHGFYRYFSASIEAADLQSFQSEISQAYPDITLAAVTAILNKIPNVLPPTQGEDPNAVGIEEAREHVTKLLSLDTIDHTKKSVVVYGVGGVGKTTLATAVFNKLDLNGYKFCRLMMDENCSNQHLKQLQEQISSDLFGKKLEFRDNVEGREKLTKDFKEAKQPLFMFIDNALRGTDLAQLLPADLSCIPQQMRILITTRQLDQTDFLLQPHSERCDYSVNYLSPADSKNILCKIALGNASASFPQGFNVDQAVEMCGGIPLLVELVGSQMKKIVIDVSACNRMLRDMKHMLDRGEYRSDVSERVVDFVYNSLDADCKEAFLDIACFFNNKPRRFVAYIVGTVQLQALEDAALVKVWRDSEVQDMDVTGILGQEYSIKKADAKEGILKVHDIVRARGRRLSESERITDKESLVEALKDEHKLRAIKGIWLPYVDGCEVKAEHVDAMHKSLRVLNLHHSIQLNGRCGRNFENLRFLNFSIRTFPMAIDFSKLQHLAYLNCEFLSPCTGNDVPELPVSLNVLHCESEHPINVLDKCDSLSSLEEIQFRGCKVNLSESFGKLQRLRFLTFADSSFSVLPKSFGQLKSLSVLKLTSCSSLSVLPESFGPNLCALQSLDMRKCSQLTTLPESFGNLCALQILDLRKCSLLTTLPESFGNLCALQSLDLGKCSLLTTLPESFGNLCALQTLDLSKCSQLTTLPESFGNLCALQRLYLRKCSQLTTFPESFGNLCALQISNLKCSLLTTLPESFGNLCALQIFFLPKCSSLASLPQSFSQLSNLKELNMVGCERLSNLPDKFGQLRSLEYLNIESCTAMERLSADFGCLTSLTHLNAKRTCSQLVRVLVDALVEMKSCSVMLEINERHMMWKVKQVMEQHILVVVCESWERACAETMCTAVLHSGSRFLHLNNDGQLAELSPSQIAGTEDEVTLLLTMCDLSSSSNSLLLESVGEWTSGEMIYVEVGELKDESEERIRGTLLNLKRPWRKVYGWIPPRLKAEEEEGIVEATAACWFSTIMAALT